MRNRGFTMLELVVALGILMVLMGSALGVFGEMTYFLGNQDTMAAFAIDSSTAFLRMEQELRKVGRATVAGVDYPKISNNADAFMFVRLASPPCLYDGSTDLQWDPTVFTIKAINNELAVWNGNTKKIVLCRNVQAITFAIAGRKLTIDLTLEGADSRGQLISQNVRRIIVIRN